MQRIIREHWVALCLAVLYGVMLMAPFGIMRYQLGSQFQGVYPWITDNEYFYVARIQEVIDGHSLISNAYLTEHKTGLPQQLFLAEFLLAQPLKLFGFSAYEGRILWSGVLGFAIFFLTYLLFLAVSKGKGISLAVAAALLFGFWLKIMARPVSPQFNSIFWLTSMLFLWKMVVEEPTKKRWWILSGVNLGFLFYIYPYYWTYYVILAGLLFFAFFIAKQKILALNLLKMIAVAGAISIPYWYWTIKAMQLPEYTETLVRIGMIYSHFPSGIKVIAWSLAGLALLIVGLKEQLRVRSPQVLFFVATLVACMIAVNQHVITGQNFQFSNHYTQTTLFVMVLAMLHAFQKYLHARWTKMIPVLVVITALAGTIRFFETTTAHADHFKRQRYGEVFQWLNEHTPKDSVVYADADLSEAIPAFTHNNVYYAPSSVLFFVSDREILDRFLISNYFENIDRDFIMRNINPIYGAGFQTRYAHIVQENKLRKLLRLPLKPAMYVPEEAVQHVLTEAQRIQSQPFTQVLKTYRVDYMVTEQSSGELKIIPVP